MKEAGVPYTDMEIEKKSYNTQLISKLTTYF